MGNGMCSRKQKRILQSLLLLTVVFGFIYGAMLYYEVQSQLRKAEAVALKYQQHQESLSAQLQGKRKKKSFPPPKKCPPPPPPCLPNALSMCMCFLAGGNGFSVAKSVVGLAHSCACKALLTLTDVSLVELFDALLILESASRMCAVAAWLEGCVHTRPHTKGMES